MQEEEKQLQKAVSVKIEGLKKSFGTQLVLDNISLTINAGETFAIMGPSGSGKSVLLKNIIGLMRPDDGKILIDDLDASSPKTHQKIVTSIVFQAGALFNSMSVFDNLAFYPREHRLYPRAEIRQRVDDTLAKLSLTDAARKFPSELSGGMRKRVAIARSLMMRPQLLLYDEPTAELDPIMAATISEIIGTLNEESHVTSVVVTHDRDLFDAIADRAALIFDGKIRVVGTPQELRKVDDSLVQEFLNPSIDVEKPRFKKQKI